MKHVIIGGSGFTGQLLARELLHQGHEVTIADINSGRPSKAHANSSGACYIAADITEADSLRSIPLSRDDVVYHLAARQYHLPVPSRSRSEFFDQVNFHGTANVLAYMNRVECHKLVYFSTDMVYGLPEQIPVTTAHPRRPLGPYGQSKRKSEDLCFEYREKGFQITIFRPRLIIGPGRLGVLEKLFSLIDKNLPVPLIGDGSNHYQMVSVFDCVSAIDCARARGFPNSQFNLGSNDPPSVKSLLAGLIDNVGSRSILLATPGSLVKLALKGLDRLGLTLLYEEQFAIADKNYLVDIYRTQLDLGWSPRYRDEDMIYQAYREYKEGISPDSHSAYHA